MDRLNLLGQLLDQLRPQVRPEGDATFGQLRTALDQAKADAADAGAAPTPTPIDVQLAELASGAENDRATLASISNSVSAIRDAVGV